MNEHGPLGEDALGERLWDLVADPPVHQNPADALLHVGRRARRMRMLTQTAAVAAVLAAGISAFAIAGPTGGHDGQGSPIAARPSQPAATWSLPPRSFAGTPQSGPAHPALGTPYPYDLFTHCGIHYATFGGRTWATATALPEPTPTPDAHGTTTYTGYLAGYMILVAADEADFTTGGSTPIVFHPTTQTAPLCA
jgi:hypothetical protein